MILLFADSSLALKAETAMQLHSPRLQQDPDQLYDVALGPAVAILVQLVV